MTDINQQGMSVAPSPDGISVVSRIALAAWFASLFLPGFIVRSQTEPLFGGMILAMGLMFGWAVNGWAAYANLFFLYIVIRSKPAPIAASLMILLALSILAFKGVIWSEGSGAILPVVSWGWGAILWACSLVATAWVTWVRADWIGRRGSFVIIAVLVSAVSASISIHFVQRTLANEQEREMFLPIGMAFTTSEFCHLDFVWREDPAISADDVVTVAVEDELRSKSSPSLLLPTLTNVQDDRYRWRTYYDSEIRSVQIKIRAAALSPRYVLQARSTKDGAVIRISDLNDDRLLYEQPLRRVKNGFEYVQYCPYSTHQWSGLKKGYDTAILRVIGQFPIKKQKPEPLREESVRFPCPLSDADIDGIAGLREWDGRQVILEPPSVRTRVGFCSNSYIGLVYVSAMPSDGSKDLSPVVQLFDRKTMRPLANFNDGRPCPIGNRCTEAPKSIIKGFRVGSDSVVVETEQGDLPAYRIRS